MVHKLRCLSTVDESAWKVASKWLVVVLCLGLASGALAQSPRVHLLHHGAMPPGAIGSLQLQRGGPLPGFFQPVEIKAPQGVTISMAEAGAFSESVTPPCRFGFLIGQVYRFRVMNIPLAEGMEIYPTIEVIDRLYAPPGQQLRFPIIIELSYEDLRLALSGRFVTRVIYLEDPSTALPVGARDGGQDWFEVEPGRDPLSMADQLGRPVAILRLGARLPSHDGGPNSAFLFGSPPMMKYRPRSEDYPALPKKPTPRPTEPAKPTQPPALQAGYVREMPHR